jgi:hypothetical protein
MPAWLLTCPQCRRAYTVPFSSSWACPVSENHGPIRVRAAV